MPVEDLLRVLFEPAGEAASTRVRRTVKTEIRTNQVRIGWRVPCGGEVRNACEASPPASIFSALPIA